MIATGFICALAVGIVLGLLGAGGSILMVPILVYFFSVTPVLATTYSLLIVGLSAVAGAAMYSKEKIIDWKTGVSFAIPSLMSVLVVRLFLWPIIPAQIEVLGISKNHAVMLAFALIMLISTFTMLKSTPSQPTKRPRQARVVVHALVVGAVTGFLGVGGGFLIVPALHLLLKLPMRTTVATSLVVIAINSLFGFLLDLLRGAFVEWGFIATFLSITFAGVFLGKNWSARVSEVKLKRSFALFVIIIAVLILARELNSILR